MSIYRIILFDPVRRAYAAVSASRTPEPGDTHLVWTVSFDTWAEKSELALQLLSNQKANVDGNVPQMR